MVGDPSDDIPPVAPGVPTDSAGSVVGTGEAPLDLGYTVTVDSFSGPLDLLLYLVRRTELDILEVPLSLIVDQFVDTVRSWQDADLDVAGEFILMAATLLELKARTIAPPLEQPEEGAEDEPAFDPRESLLKSLLAYRRFKEASQVLDGLEERRRPLLERQVREHIPEAPPEEGDFELGEIDLSLLATTCERILSRIGGLGPRTVVVDEMPLGVRIATMLDELSARERATIRELLEGNHSRVVHITTVMATLELARQRFIEVAQYEQFGDISLRLRTAEERERQPELPPPEPEGPKRRRKLPLVTWHPPAQSAEAAAAAASNADDESAADAAIEESTETDEQRFLRELEEATRVTAVLALTADVEKSFTEHWYTLHPELRPVAPPTPPPPEPVAKRFPNRRPPGERRPADKPPAETPATEQPVAPAAGAATTTETPAPVAAETGAAGTVAAEPVATPTAATEEAAAAAAVAPTTPVEVTASSSATTPIAEAVPVVADDRAASAAATPPVTEVEVVAQAQPAEIAPVTPSAPTPNEPVAASAPLSESVHAAAAPVVEVAAAVETAAPVATEAATPSTAPAESPAAELTPGNVVAEAVAAPVSEAGEPVSAAASLVTESPESVTPVPVVTEVSESSSAVVTPAAAEPAAEPTVAATNESNEPQAVLPVEQWPVMHAQPVPEEAPHPLDTVTSDDPSAVNELLSDVPRRASQPRDEDEHEDDEDEIDPDELLADDPALVNAALQADKPRPVVERRPVPEAIIPAATETTVWTAPVDRGQTASEIDADDDVAAVTPPAPADDAPAVVVSTSPTEQLTAEATQPMVASPNVETEPSAPAAVEVSDEAVAAAVAMMRPTAEPPSAAVASSTTIPEPTPSTEPLVVAAPTTTDVVAAAVEPSAVELPPAAPASSTTITEPTPSTEPLVVATPTTTDAVAAEAAAADFEPDEVVDLAAEDPALVDAAAQADAVRPPVERRPVHDFVIPAATETTVYTAPVDRGQTTSDDVAEEDLSHVAELEPVAPVSVVNSITPSPDVAAAEAPAAEPTSALVASDSVVVAPITVAPDAPVESEPLVDTAAAVAAAASAAPGAPAVTNSDVIAEPTPTTAPLVLSEPAPMSAVSPAEPPPAVAAEPSPPPNEAAPPGPDGPPPAPRSDSPLPAPITTPIPNRPMSPPPRSKAWLQIAILIAILTNAGWGLATWLLYLPRDVLEVIATERGGTPEHETLTWRFNLDVVDAQGRAKAPELVPVISPAIAGRWSWSDSRTLVFDAAAPLPLATTFTAALPAERFHSAQGFRLRSPAQQTWSTPALAVTAATVETFDHSGTTIAVTFNQPVDPVAIAQRLVVEVTPADGATDDLSKDLPALLRVVAGDAAPAPVTDAPAAVVPAVDTPAATRAAETAPGTPAVVATPAPAVAPAAVAPAAEPAAKSPVVATVKAISTTVDRIARLQIALPQRGTARLRLPAGTTGVGGPLGLAATWEQPVALQQTLHLVSATPAVPSHGEVRVDVIVSDVKAPRQLLAPAVSVEPAIPVTISTTDQGLSLVGAFVPGETYHIRCAATWPDDSATSGHQLAAYTAASDLTVTIPERPAGIWPLDQAPIDGQVRFAAQAVERADVMVLGEDEECLASSEATWIGMMPAQLDLDTLTAELPPATYRLRVTTSGEAAVNSEQHLLIEQVRVRPQALISALTDWMLASLAGDDAADVAVRVVRVADIPPVTPKGP